MPVYAPIGGTVETVNMETGMHVSAGETLLTYRTEKTYAAEDGTVTGVFVTAGDDAETVSAKYGADLYIEGKTLYSISGSTSRAYSSVETTFVHTGEITGERLEAAAVFDRDLLPVQDEVIKLIIGGRKFRR